MMKKICIIAPSSLRYVPYLRCYEEVLEESGLEYDIFYWDRYGLDESRPGTFVYRRAGTVSGALLVPAYIGYRRFLLSRLQAADYDVYIVLSTQVGVLLYDFLKSRRFILDIRDYSHEKLLPYKYILGQLVKFAKLVCISSEGFLHWLPVGIDYILSHNTVLSELNKNYTEFSRDKKILSYIGAVGYYDANVKFINALKNHAHLDIRYVGRGTCDEKLREYCVSNDISNVSFLGGFAPEQKESYYHDTNFVVGCYGNDNMIVKTLTPNRLYEACVYRRPLIVNSGTHLAEIVRDNGLGIVVDLDDMRDFDAQLNKYYDSACIDEFYRNCEVFLEKVRCDIALFKAKVQTVVGGSSSEQ